MLIFLLMLRVRVDGGEGRAEVREVGSEAFEEVRLPEIDRYNDSAESWRERAEMERRMASWTKESLTDTRVADIPDPYRVPAHLRHTLSHISFHKIG